jgi:integrase
MNLPQAVELYVHRKQEAGGKFLQSQYVLRAFARQVGNVPLASVALVQVNAFLEGPQTSVSTRRNKHGELRRFFEYWFRRGEAVSIPVPPNLPKSSLTFVPYIYSRRELQRLVDATPLTQPAKGRCVMTPQTFRTLILFLYGTGLRLGEALRLEWNDVNLEEGVVTVRGTKFYKWRLVPIGSDVRKLLSGHLGSNGPSGTSEPLFATKKGLHIHIETVDISFRRLRRAAGVSRQDVTTYQPRVHDLRHTFAVHRVTDWYRTGTDVQRLLPALSTYLGHTDISGTQRYLTMTPELLQQANRRFEDYVREGGRHDG